MHEVEEAEKEVVVVVVEVCTEERGRAASRIDCSDTSLTRTLAFSLPLSLSLSLTSFYDVCFFISFIVFDFYNV